MSSGEWIGPILGKGSGGGGGGAVNSVSAADGSVTVSPTTGNVLVSQTNADLGTLLVGFTSSSGVSLVDTSADNFLLRESGASPIIISSTGTGGIEIDDSGTGGVAISSAALVDLSGPASSQINLQDVTNGSIQFVSNSVTFNYYAAANLAGLPASPIAPAFATTSDQHIYFYPVGGPWTLYPSLEPSKYTLSTITADPNPGVVGTYYRGNYAASGNFTLPTSPATGTWIKIKQIANNTLSIVGTVDAITTFSITQYDSVELIYNGTTWDAN